MTTRLIEVDPERLDRWMARFAERHGPYDAAEETTPGGVVVSARAADGSTVVATPFATSRSASSSSGEEGMPWGSPAGRVHRLQGRHPARAVADGGRWLVAAALRPSPGQPGRRARRRRRRACRRVLLGDDESPRAGADGIPHGLVVGGDRTLVREVLEARALRALAGLPMRELYDLPDPKRDVLETALRRGRAVRIELTDP